MMQWSIELLSLSTSSRKSPIPGVTTDHNRHVTITTPQTLVDAICQHQRNKHSWHRWQTAAPKASDDSRATKPRPANPVEPQDDLRQTPEPQSKCGAQSGKLRLSVRGDGYIRPAKSNRDTGSRAQVGATRLSLIDSSLRSDNLPD